MATITATYDGRKPLSNDGEFMVITWANLAAGDAGNSVQIAEDFSDKTVQIVGTVSGATIVLQGSLDGTNWETLRDAQGNALSFTAVGLKSVLEATRYVRPSVSGGTPSGLNVLLYARRSK